MIKIRWTLRYRLVLNLRTPMDKVAERLYVIGVSYNYRTSLQSGVPNLSTPR
jgi:hypothetical protein